MRLDEIITEAPLGSYDIVGPLTDRGGFRERDRATITAPTTPDRLRDAFRNTRETIDIVINPAKFKVRDVVDLGQKIGGAWRREDAERKLHCKLPAPSTPEAIMMVFTHNEGANRVNLTPWIIAHRIGHGLGFSHENEFYNMYHAIRDFSQSLYYACDVTHMDVLYTIGKMRSARQRQLNSYAEFPYECFAQYLIAGRISFNRFTDPVRIKTDSGEVECGGMPAEERNDWLTKTEDSLNRRCETLLASLRGMVVVL